MLVGGAGLCFKLWHWAAMGQALPIPTPPTLGALTKPKTGSPHPARLATPHCPPANRGLSYMSDPSSLSCGPQACPWNPKDTVMGVTQAGQRASTSSEANLPPPCQPCPRPFAQFAWPPSWDCLIRSAWPKGHPFLEAPWAPSGWDTPPSAAMASRPEAHTVQLQPAEGRRDEPRGLPPSRGGLLCSKTPTRHSHSSARLAQTCGGRQASPARQCTLCSFSSGKKLRKESSRSWATTLVNLYLST